MLPSPDRRSAQESRLADLVAVSDDADPEKVALRRALDATRRQVEAVAQGVADAITVQDEHGRLVYANNAAARLLGFDSPAELLRADVTELVGRFEILTEDGSPMPLEKLPGRQALRGIGVFEKLVRYRTKGLPGDRYSLVSASPVFDDDGNVIQAVNVFRDVTAQWLADRARAVLAAIVQDSDDAIASKGLDGIVTSWNPGAERIFGFTADEMIGQPILRIIPPDLHGEEAEIMARIRRGERVEHYETRRQRKDGRLIDVSVAVSPLRDRKGTVIGASKVARDITERKREQQELVRLNLELEDRVRQRTAALEAAIRELESFNYTVSHDLRTPLRAINGFANLALREAPVTSELPRYLKFILAAAEEMNKITEALLRLAKVEQATPDAKPIDLSTYALQAVSTLQQNHPDRKIEIRIEPELATVADPAMARIVVDNLISNAWKFTSRVTQPRIEVGREERFGDEWFFVRDNGVGFSSADKEFLFKPFRRLRPQEFEGTGVGLATVKKIIDAHGGSLDVEAYPGKGAVFRFRFARWAPA